MSRKLEGLQNSNKDPKRRMPYFLFCRCTSENSHLLRIDLDGISENFNISIRNSRFYSTTRKTRCRSLLSAISILMRCQSKNNSVQIADSSFTNLVGLQGSAIQVRGKRGSSGEVSLNGSMRSKTIYTSKKSLSCLTGVQCVWAWLRVKHTGQKLRKHRGLTLSRLIQYITHMCMQ